MCATCGASWNYVGMLVCCSCPWSEWKCVTSAHDSASFWTV